MIIGGGPLLHEFKTSDGQWVVTTEYALKLEKLINELTNRHDALNNKTYDLCEAYVWLIGKHEKLKKENQALKQWKRRREKKESK
jgi:hypothetical protein